MKDQIVKELIGDWEVINEQTSPTSILFEEDTSYNESLVDVSFLSSRKEFWESTVCLLSFADNAPGDAEVTIKNIIEDINTPGHSGQTNDFLTYSQNYTGLDENSIKTSLNVVYGVSPEGNLVDLIPKLSQYELCRKLFPDDPKGFVECLLGR